MSLRIGSYTLQNRLVLAPMAGITDRPFRLLCRQLGAAAAVSEMVSANPQLRHSRKSSLRRDHTGEPDPIIVQIAGADPATMAEAAQYNVDQGAQIIDINMGCPAKKVCKQLAGSALMQDEDKVARILDAVVNAVDVPVTLKIRTGWNNSNKNALKIAHIAESLGVQLLSVHGRTRTDGFKGQAEYETIRAVKESIHIPVLANGDINCAEDAKKVLDYTGADGLLIGRAAQGNPWIFREIDYYLSTGKTKRKPALEEVRDILLTHMDDLYKFYGAFAGTQIARKHIGWYLKENYPAFWPVVNKIEQATDQYNTVKHFLTDQINQDRQPKKGKVAA